MMQISFGDGAPVVSWDRTGAKIANTGNRHAIQCVMRGLNFDHFSTMASGVAESNDVRHD